MAESTIVLRSPVKSTSTSTTSSPTSSPLHHSTVIILKDNNSKSESQSQTQSSTPSLKTVQQKLYYAGHTGLYNLGNTCYVNCVLQLLSHVPQFCDAICSMSFESLGLEQPSDVPQATSSHNPTRLKGGGRGLLKALEAQPRRVPCYLAYELHGTFNIIWSGKCMVYSPLNMIAAVRRLLPTFEPCAMEDAQEFLEALLSAVTDEIKTNKLADTNIINDLLGFSSESQILCEQCRRLSVTKTDETFITLTFSEKMLCDSRGSSRRRSCHLTEMLAHFYQWEALSTPFQCSTCTVRNPSKEGTKAQKRLLISKLPQVLHVVLRRFRSLPQTNLRRPTSRQARQLSHKITMHVNFDEYLDMAPYCASSTSTHSNSSSNECIYRLRGVIVHYGKSINTGHFVAFVYNDVLGEWLRCDDHIIEQTTFEAVKTSDAYILVYSRCASSSISSNIANRFVEQSISNVEKRKRANSLDYLNEQKDESNVRQIENEKSNLTESLKFFCMNFDPLANGLRRRAQSLNIAIRTNQSIPIESSLTPVTKRRRYETIENLLVNENVSTPVKTSIVSQTRKRSSPNSVNQPTKTTRRRRRTADPFTRKRRMTKTSQKKRQINPPVVLPVTDVPTIDPNLSPIPNDSLRPTVHSSLTFTYENPNPINPSIPKRIGRIRIQRCLDESNINATVRLISTGDSNTRLAFSCQPILQTNSSSSSFSTSLISERRSISLNNSIVNPSSSS